MRKGDTGSYQQPGVDQRGLAALKLLEAELFRRDAELERFGLLRERLAAVGRDPTVTYREIAARRDLLQAELRRLTPKPAEGVALPEPRLDRPLSELAVAPAFFLPDLGVHGLGSSGFVQTGRAADGVSVVPGGADISGEIVTTELDELGAVRFSGWLQTGPDSIPPEQYDPTIQHWWLRNWSYLVPFPAPPTRSVLTYRFDVYVEAGIFLDSLEATFMSFVSVGETAKLTPGQDVVVDTSVGWPLIHNLREPGPGYNGHYGRITGWLMGVQRSFIVQGGQAPAVGIVVGAVTGLAMMAGVRLAFPQDSVIAPTGSEPPHLTGRVAYHYRPDSVLAPPD
jgi:hypothetical protein